MSKLRAFFKRHILLVGLIAVVVPLLSIIGLQYLSLRKLEKTSIVAGNVGMKNYLGGVSSEVKMFYKSSAEQALSVPAYSVEGDNLCDIKEHFPVCKVEGAKRLFIAAFAPDGEQQTLAKYFPDGTDSNVIVTVYDEHDNPLLSSQEARGQNDEIKTNLSPYFYNYKVGIRSRHMTPEQWAHLNFNYSLSLSLLMTA